LAVLALATFVVSDPVAPVRPYAIAASSQCWIGQAIIVPPLQDVINDTAHR
jgi:hypothetical protein